MNTPAETRRKIAVANRAMNEMTAGLNRRFNTAQPAPAQPPAKPAPRYSRDHQRGALYDAERRLRRVLDRAHEYPMAEVAGSRIVIPVERKFADLASMQTYVDLVLARPWPEFPRMNISHVAVVPKPEYTEQNHAVYTGGAILVPLLAVNPATGTRWAMRELVVLHELAHHAMFVHRPGAAHHGAEFAGAFRTLVAGMMGPEAGLLFDVIFRDGGVRVA